MFDYVGAHVTFDWSEPMKTNLLKLNLLALAFALPACGAAEQPANNAVADGEMTITNGNAIVASEMPSDATNNAASSTVAPSVPTPPTTARAPTPPVAVAPKAVPKPAPKAPPPAEPEAPVAPTCAPEHRALGHC